VRGRGKFRWGILMDPNENSQNRRARVTDATSFDSQHWTSNVNPTEQYVLSLPGTQKYRISPLDNTYDNLTVAGDWTMCGLDAGCVEAAVISGMLAAHAISGSPALEDIIAYDHP
jgi:predicted NAD/FAD-dependent oxidoreductase